MPPSVGMRFGRYELLARLGAGGMGEVWRARDLDLHREVAVKFLPERFASDPLRMGRFAQEARAASSLNHPNIVTIHEIGETAGLPYIVMERVQGETARELIADGRPLAPRRLLDLAVQLADGLAKAHAAGIVHRDLKPDNLMVTPDGFVKILDFGLAKLRSDSGEGVQWFDSGAPTWPDSPSPQTAAGVVLGTVGYMSPEQARGRSVDHRSDQFAFGAILYELATGQQAFRRDSPAQTLAAIIEDAPPPIAQRSPGLPAPLRWLIETRCLAKDPGERYAATVDLARELRALREHASDAASGFSRDALASSAARRNLRRVLPAVAALLTLVALGGLFGPRLVKRLGQPALPAQKQLAVLPFEAPAGGEDEALARGLVYLTTARLAELEPFQAGLTVQPASNVLESGVRSASAARRRLGATLVVTGSVQHQDGRLLLTANLEDAQGNRTLRAARAESADALVDKLAALLDLELGDGARAALAGSRAGVAEAATLAAQGHAYTPYAAGRSALERYQDSRSLERAIEQFQQALEREPAYALAHVGLAEAYWKLYLNEKRPEHARLAEEHCRRALAADPLPARVWVTLAMVHTGTGRPEQALEDVKAALVRDPRNADAQRERADALARLGRPAEAEAAFRKALELRPELWYAHNQLGAFLYESGRYKEAEASFRAALERAPDNALALTNLGAALFADDRTAEAQAAWQRSLEIQPWPEAAANLGTLHFSAGRFAEAARSLEQAARLAPRNYRIWRSFAAALYWSPADRPRAAEAYAKAAELAEQERRVDPADARAAAALADCYAMLGRAEPARRAAAEALRLAPADQRVAATVAGARERLGEREAALRSLALALRAGYPRAMIDTDPSFEALRQDARWARLASAPPSPDHKED